MKRTARELLNAESITLKNYAMGEHRGACPQCASAKARANDDALAVKIDERGFTSNCHRCAWTSFGFYEEREARKPTPGHNSKRIISPAPTPPSGDERKLAVVMGILKETETTDNSAVENYLRSRAIAGPLPKCIRSHPRLWHSDLKSTFPAMVAPFRDIKSNTICGLHRTYLKVDGTGKITEGTARKMLGRSKGAVVKLTPDDQVEQGLAIAEGIETALTVMQAGYPVWATGAANGIAEFPVLAGIECLTIFADPDPVGMVAAQVCAQRWHDAGAEARILTPTTGAGHDWNDFARAAQ